MHIVEENTLKPQALEKINFVPNKRRSVYMRLYGMKLLISSFKSYQDVLIKFFLD